jgi:hypothetical protein
VAQWKAHFKSGPSEVYRALGTPLGRSRYWAESADERDQVIRFVLPEGRYDADHVALLLRLKASVDFGVDLRNHDKSRTAHYADS